MARKPPPVKQIIIQRARKYGLDPAAVLAVARGEGGLRWGAVGDNGTSHGPFQLRVGGANPYTGEKARAFANSPEGVDYALRKMAESGARGLKGAAAIDAIVRKFERPFDPDTSVRNAVARLGSSAVKPARAVMPAPPAKTATGNMGAIPPQAAGTLNDIFRKVGLKPLDIVGDIPLSRQQPSPPVPGRAVPRPIPAAGPAQPFKGGRMPRVQRMVGLIEYAQQLGLSVRENPYTDKVDPVHTTKSHHYQTIGKHRGKKVGRAIDVSGDSKAMLAFFKYASRYPGIDDVFHDPAGYSVDRGRRWDKTIGGHGSHVHASIK